MTNNDSQPITFQLEPQDLILAAQSNNLLPALSFYAIISISLIIKIIVKTTSQELINSTPDIVTIVIATIYFLVRHYVYLPFQIRKIYNQSSSYQAPTTLSIYDQEVHFSNEMSQSTISWGLFSRWKQTPNLFLLYLPNQTMYILPKAKVSQSIISVIENKMIENNVVARTPFPTSHVMYAILAVIIIFMVDLIGH